MKKWLIITCLLILMIICSIVIGITITYYSNISHNEIDSNKEFAYNDNKLVDQDSLEVIKTSYSEFKVSPNATIVFEVYYNKCKHREVKEEKADTSLVNLNEQEIQEQYKEWTIKQFSEEKVILYKDVDEYCDNHYVLREKDGYIGIFKVKKNGEEKLEELTSVLVQYLPETDNINIKNGLKVYTKENLNKILEDFE